MNESTDLPRQFFLKFYFVNVLYEIVRFFWSLKTRYWTSSQFFFARRRLTRIFDRTIDWKRAWTRTFCTIRGRRWIETKSLLEINLHDVLMFYLGSQVEFRFISVFLFKSILSFFLFIYLWFTKIAKIQKRMKIVKIIKAWIRLWNAPSYYQECPPLRMASIFYFDSKTIIIRSL